MCKFKALAAALSLVVLHCQAADITLRHGLTGHQLDALSTLVAGFNEQQKGRDRVMLQSVDGVDDKRHLPVMALLDPDDTRAFFDGQPRFLPVQQVMTEGGERLDASRFFPQMADAASDVIGRIQGLPMGMTLPALLYNKAAFEKAGLDPRQPPQTWWKVQEAAGKLYQSGVSTCPLTTSRFVWVHLENLSAQHGSPVFEGLGKSRRLAVNSMVHVKHLALLSSWNKSNYFHYFGSGQEGVKKFETGECAMITGESSLFRQVSEGAAFPLGIAALPHYDDVYGVKPQDVLPDGQSLFVLPGGKKADYKVAARFLAYVQKPEVQRDWVKATGYLPMTPAALAALGQAGVDGALLAEARNRLAAPHFFGTSGRAAFRARVREILDEELEAVWKNTKPAKAALDAAVRRANALPPEIEAGQGGKP